MAVVGDIAFARTVGNLIGCPQRQRALRAADGGGTGIIIGRACRIVERDGDAGAIGIVERRAIRTGELPSQRHATRASGAEGRRGEVGGDGPRQDATRGVEAQTRRA